MEALLRQRAQLVAAQRALGGGDEDGAGIHGNLAQLANLFGDDDSSKTDSHLKNAVKLIYHSSKSRVLGLGAKLVKGAGFTGDVPKNVHEVPLPEDCKRNLALGDWVEIKFSLSEFKTIQKATLGWNSKLNMVHGHVAIITGLKSQYQNSIELFFPEVFSGCHLHAGVLSKIDRKKYENYQTSFKPGDFVKTISEKRLALILQRGLGPIPPDSLGKIGRVISISQRSVEVTFDETSSVHVNPAALIPTADETPIQNSRIVHERGFQIGERVQMISNMKRLIKNQKGRGEWATEMSMLRGKEVTITSILPDGTVYVQLPQKNAWRVSPDSILKDGEYDSISWGELGFVPDDVVKIKFSNDLRSILFTSRIPLSFLEYIRCPARIGTIDDDLDCYLLFNADQHIEVDPKALRKANMEEVKKYWEVEKKVENLQAGDTVHLDAGPPNYVQAVLSECKVDPAIAAALTKSATLIGFTDQHNAVIEYENGQRYKIKKKYLTIPEKFNISELKDGINLKSVQEIEQVVSKALANLHIENQLGNDGWSVDILTMIYGMPPIVELKVISPLVKPDDVYRWLRKYSEWKISDLSDGMLIVEGVKGYDGEIKVGIFFNEDEVGITPPAGAGHGTYQVMHEERTEGKNEAEPIPGHDPSQHRGPRAEQPQPNITFEEFKYLRFYDPSLAQDVYFPYVLHGPQRTPVRPLMQESSQPGARQEIRNIPSSDRISY